MSIRLVTSYSITDGKKTLRRCVIVQTEYERVTDRQTDRQTDILPRHSPRYACASRGKKIRRLRCIPTYKAKHFGQIFVPKIQGVGLNAGLSHV